MLPKRWVVEGTFAWLTLNRRHSKDYKKTTQSGEAIVDIAMIALMTKRLAKKNHFLKHGLGLLLLAS